MTAHTIQDGGIPAALVYTKDFDSKEKSATPPATPPHNRLSATADCSATAAAFPVSPCPSEELPTPGNFVIDELSFIEDKYSVDPRVLGTGHHGSVRRCVDEATGRSYAVKSIRKSNPKVKLDDLAREVALLQKMNHDSIIQLVDVFEDVEQLHLVTDLCEGGELYDRIVERSSQTNGTLCLTEDEAAGIVCQILTAISYMHELGIVHRDLKPENILFDTTAEDSPIKLVDFGLSKKHHEDLEPPMTSIVGTPYYIAPEVLRKRYNKSCDMWSLGVITYTLLCGYTPFNGDNKEEVHRAVFRGRYYFVPEDWKDVSPEARNFVRRLLQIDPKIRMTAKQALSHPWLARHSHKSVEVKCRRPTRSIHPYVGQEKVPLRWHYFKSMKYEGHAGDVDQSGLL